MCHSTPFSKLSPSQPRKRILFLCVMLARSLSLLWKDGTIVEEIKHHFCRSKIDTRGSLKGRGVGLGEFDFGTGVGAAGALLGPVGRGTVRSKWWARTIQFVENVVNTTE